MGTVSSSHQPSRGDARRAERTLRVDLPIVLPGIAHAGDACVQRVMDRMAGQRGVLDAHIVGGDVEHDPALPSTGTEAELCLHYDPHEVDLDALERLVEDAGAAVDERYGHQRVRVHGMGCADCVTSIEHVVARHPGVLDVSVNYAAERMHVEWDGQQTDLDAIVDRVEAMGYPIDVEAEHAHDHGHGRLRLASSLAGAILLVVGFLGEMLLGFPHWAAIAFYAGAYVGAGWDAAQHAWGALRGRALDIDVLMVAAALGAAGLGLWAEGALLLVLFSLGHALEHRALDKARSAIAELGRLAPETAHRVTGEHPDQTSQEVPVEEIQIGDLVHVRPGERIPIDGEIQEGTSAVDEATLTGEHRPVRKAPGEEVFAGTLNGDDRLLVEATSAGHDTTLAHVAELVDRAQTRKAGMQRASERFERWLTPTVLVLVALVMGLPPLVTALWPAAPGWLALPWRTALTRGIAVLVASAPCALAISTPAAVLSALSNSAHAGVLVKGGDHLETMGDLEAIAFDKTGTLTEGRFTVSDIQPVSQLAEHIPGPASEHDEPPASPPEGEQAPHRRARLEDGDRLLALAASLEHDVAHPIARAIVAEANERDLELSAVAELSRDPGRGVVGQLEGAQIRVGSLAHVEPVLEAIPAAVRQRAQALQAEGKTVVFLTREDRIEGLIALADRARPEAARVVAALEAAGVERTLMLTGDNETAARAIAEEVGIEEVHANLRPEDKAERVREMAQTNEPVALVGDGVNDAPAMAQAHLGIAMGARGSDVALETADVALLGEGLQALPGALELGSRTQRVIYQNLAISLLVIAALVPLATLGLAGIAPAIVAHEGSTLLVVANGLRLL